MNTISFLIFTYNHEAQIEKCLTSILEQKNITIDSIIIHDDYSTDNTRKIITDFAEKNSGKVKFEFIFDDYNKFSKNKKLPARDGFKRGLNTKSKYIHLMDGDDSLCDVNKVFSQISGMNEHEKPISFSECIYKSDLKTYQRYFIFKKYLISNFYFTCLTGGKYLCLSSLVLKKECLKYFSNAYWELDSNTDYDLKLMVSKIGIFYLPSPSVEISKNLPGSFSHGISKRSLKDELNFLVIRNNSFNYMKKQKMFSIIGLIFALFATFFGIIKRLILKLTYKN